MRGGYVHNHSTPFVRVDPDNRCAAMLVYGKKIVILPFRKDIGARAADAAAELEDIYEDEKGTGKILKNRLSVNFIELCSPAKVSSSPVLASYTLDLNSVITHNVDNIIDLQFLHGYNQPTLLILYEPLKTFAG